MGRPAGEGESPVNETSEGKEKGPEYVGARGILTEAAGTIPQG